MEDEPKSKANLDLSNIESIQNLDTARMALRWALERLRVLDKTKADAEKAASKAGREASARAAEALQSDLYSAKMETWLLRKLGEKLNVSGLQQPLEQKVSQLELEVAAKRAELEARPEGVPQQTLEKIKHTQERLAYWEKVLEEDAAVEDAKGALRQQVRDLGIKMQEQKAPQIPPVPAVEKTLRPEPQALKIARTAWQNEKERLLRALQEREAQIQDIKSKLPSALPPGAPAPEPSPLMPEGVTQALVEKFQLMLRSWDDWEAARRRDMEQQRQSRRERLLKDLGSEFSSQGMREKLAASRQRALEEAEKAQAEAVEEFRRMLMGWEMEHASRRKTLEKALEEKERRLSRDLEAHIRTLKSAGVSPAQEAIETLHKRLEQQEGHYKILLSEQQKESERIWQERVHDIEQEAKSSVRALKLSLTVSEEEAKALRKRLQEQEESHRKLIERQKEDLRIALEARRAEWERQIQPQVDSLKTSLATSREEAQARKQQLEEMRVHYEDLLAQRQQEARQALCTRSAELEREGQARINFLNASLASSQDEIQALKKKLLEQEDGQAKLLTHQQEKALKTLSSRCAEIESEAQKRVESLKSALASAQDEIQALQKRVMEPQEAGQMREEALRLRKELEKVSQEFAAYRAQQSEAGRGSADSAAAAADMDALRKQLEETQQKASIQEREFKEIQAQLLSVCQAYMRELEQWSSA